MDENITLEELKAELKNVGISDESIIKDNKMPFKVENDKTSYQVRMPTQRELSFAETERNKLWVRLIKEKDSVLKKSLIKTLKANHDIDISALEQQKENLKVKLHDAWISLATSNDKDTKRITKYKELVEEIGNEYIQVFYEIEKHLSPCIENQTDAIYLKLLASFCAEKYNEKKAEWQPLWKNYEQFEADNSPVATQARLKFGDLYKYSRGY